MMNLTERSANFLSNAGHKLSILFLGLLFVLVNAEVFTRYFLNRSTLIADEYGGYLYVGICFFGFAYALRSEQFLKVSFLVDRLGSRARQTMQFLSCLLGTGIVAVMAWEAFKLLQVSWWFNSVSIQPSSTPLIYPQGVMLLGIIVLLIAFLAELVKSLAVILNYKQIGN